MWSAGAERLQAYVGTRHAALCSDSACLQQQPASGHEHALSLLEGWLRRHAKKPRLQVWLSGGLCRPFLLNGVQALRGAQELDAAAHATAQRLLGKAAVRLWLDLPAPRTGPLLGVTASEPLLTDLEQRLKPLCHGALQVAPWWSAALPFAAGAATADWVAVAVRDCDALTLVASRARVVELVRTASPIDDQACVATLSRWLLAAGISPDDVVRIWWCQAPRNPGREPAAGAPWACDWP